MCIKHFITYRIVLLFLVLGMFASCKGTKAVSGSSMPSKHLSTKQLIQAHSSATPRFKTLAARLQVKYEDPKSSKSITVSLRMEKDKNIWIKASILGVTLAKVLITPDRVSYYETLSNTYFDGDFTLISNWLGTEIDFKQAQNILLGQSIFSLDTNYTLSVFNNKYKLEPQKQPDNFIYSILLNPDTFTVNYESLSQPHENRLLTVFYGNYTKINNSYYPSKIHITSTENEEKTNINLTYKKIDVNAPVRFPFTIPNGYKEIILD